jgi:hypothetical protein
MCTDAGRRTLANLQFGSGGWELTILQYRTALVLEMRSHLIPCVAGWCGPALILWETLGLVSSRFGWVGERSFLEGEQKHGEQINGFMANAASSCGSAVASGNAGLTCQVSNCSLSVQARAREDGRCTSKDEVRTSILIPALLKPVASPAG